ncbi:MAG TPA: thiol:disulfide interchange protein DsbA/DsbL [Casimicrobiaceae bacterium]|nr:thiol:disulfide interchange protein DsbA/DsbL [Casimicrobiaceae bacterium]
MKSQNHSRLRRRLVAAIAISAFTGGSAIAQALVEGQNYLRLKNPQPVDSGKSIEVLYFFSYGCPHCRDFDPELQPWLKTLPADVEFRRVPVDFGREQWANLGKVLYTLEAIGAEKSMTSDVFVALHDKKMPLSEPKVFFDWAAGKGLDRKKVEDTYNSFGVNSKMSRARQLAKNYNVQSVPVVFVDGKFQVSAEKVGTHQAMPAAMNQLIAKARAERPKS